MSGDFIRDRFVEHVCVTEGSTISSPEFLGVRVLRLPPRSPLSERVQDRWYCGSAVFRVVLADEKSDPRDHLRDLCICALQRKDI